MAAVSCLWSESRILSGSLSVSFPWSVSSTIDVRYPRHTRKRTRFLGLTPVALPAAARARKQAHLSPMQNPKASPITPEVHGGDGYATPHGAGAPMPAPHMTPGTQAAVAMSNMSLSPMPHPNNNTWAPPQNQQVCGFYYVMRG